jgi:hypothetical protein
MDRVELTKKRSRRRWPALAALVAAAALAGSIATLPAAIAAPAGRSGPLAAATLPPDWPADVPVAPGQLQGATGGGGQWSLLLLVRGSAAEALRSTAAFYASHGFHAESGAILRKGSRRVTIVVENRDHSPNETFIVVAVTTVRAAPGRVALRTSLSGRAAGLKGPAGAGGRVSVLFTGTRVCWTFRALHGIDRPRSASIRQGAAGRSGPIMVKLGRPYRASGCTKATPGLDQSMAANPAGFYVVVATRRFPLGALRGQLRAG